MGFSKYVLTTVQHLLSTHQKNIETVNQRADKIIVWLVGFSIGAIVLLISKNINIGEGYNISPFILILFCSLTIIFGILYRITAYISEIIGNDLLLSLKAGVIGHENPNTIHFPRNIDENSTLEQIRKFIAEEFNLELPLEKIVNLSAEEKEKTRKLFIEILQKRASKISSEDLLEINKIKVVIKKSLGCSEREINKLFEPQNRKINYRIYSWSYRFSWIFFILTNLVFLCGFLIFLINLTIIKICG
jgi:hypothetical protein